MRWRVRLSMMPTPRPDPILGIVNALERDAGGVASVGCPDLGLRGWLVEEVESLVPASGRPVRVSSVDDAVAAPDRVALLIPPAGRDRELILELDGSRDRLRDRSQPVVLFLL